MAERGKDGAAGSPWLTIIGLGEDGLDGLGLASRRALERAELVFGGPRHLALAGAGDRGRPWPVPFSVAPVLAARGRPVAVLASGDPFWHGAGPSLTAALDATEWVAHPAPSTFSLAAARLGWPLADCLCRAVHAAPFEILLQDLAAGARLICLVRDGAAVGELAAWLTGQGFGASRLTVMEALGGPRERLRGTTAAGFDLAEIAAPVAVAVAAAGAAGLPHSPGLPDALFEHDGQITKRAMRALTLSALAPRPGERLWDIGAGAGSVGIEWLLAAKRTTVCAVESDPERAERIGRNAGRFGVAERLAVTVAKAPDGLADLPPPQAVFVGGGAGPELLDRLWAAIPSGTRLVANAVTLESEALLADWSARAGGQLLRIELAEAAPLGRKRGWKSARPVVQWSVTR